MYQTLAGAMGNTANPSNSWSQPHPVYDDSFMGEETFPQSAAYQGGEAQANQSFDEALLPQFEK